MFDLLFLIFLAPFLGFIVLTFGRKRLSENTAAAIGIAAIGVAALTTLALGIEFLVHPPAGGAFTQPLWQWLDVGGFRPRFALRLDGLSLTMLGVITGVGFFIHVFSAWYMREYGDCARFFSYMNLFVASMLFLVLGDNLLFLFFGWEGVGLCSYLLIGFWYKDPANGAAARKAFIVTRVGDALMAIGLFWLFRDLGTLDIQQAVLLAQQHLAPGGTTITAITLLLLGGAVGKSAQLPLQTWLPDAMAGPTPVSALIHAATMVTAGVYLIARTHGLFELAPYSLEAVGVIGAATLLLASCAALVQSDIKRILAYSTMSQIGYMFLALGSGAWSASIFHLMTHAFFKALLFLTSGAVILACHHEQDIFKMGGLRKQLPLEYACFLVGGLALSAFPWVTAGYYSKDEILWEAYAGGHAGFFLAGLIGAFLTPLYTFRLIFTVFHGEARMQAHRGQGVTYWLPLAVLLVFSTFIGGMLHPPLAGVLPAPTGHAVNATRLAVGILSSTVALAGIAVACGLFLGRRRLIAWLGATPAGRLLGRWWLQDWGFDWLYDRLLVRPFVWFAKVNIHDGVDLAILAIPAALRALNRALVRTETGRIRWYAAGMAAGAVLVVAMVFV
ncbi:MAG TPA: NADH-quinone oxidoreductase subunit L [Steroidobacteraceae bacterium]|nr:NADH-quinone oxidoreductase subunit L [Steroidobacteraceae bacterium]HUA23699.1 NADH-quinone oxidoreductase subunit L [Steroidobacteraceae bacterium]